MACFTCVRASWISSTTCCLGHYQQKAALLNISCWERVVLWHVPFAQDQLHCRFKLTMWEREHLSVIQHLEKSSSALAKVPWSISVAYSIGERAALSVANSIWDDKHCCILHWGMSSSVGNEQHYGILHW
jgi:hypothetical protein